LVPTCRDQKDTLFKTLNTLFETQDPENHTLSSGTYPLRPSKGVPRPGGNPRKQESRRCREGGEKENISQHCAILYFVTANHRRAYIIKAIFLALPRVLMTY